MEIIKNFICGKCYHRKNDDKLVNAIKQSLRLDGKKAWIGLYDMDGVTYDIFITMKKKEGQ